MTILVTGATGKVGRQVVTQLGERGAKVRALVRDPDAAGLPGGTDVVRGDLTDVDSVRAALAGVDAVFLIWPFFDAEALPPVLAAIAEQTQRVVYLSSAGADDPERPTQWAGDVERLIEQTSLEWTFLRPTGFAGNILSFAPQIKQDGVVREAYGDMPRPLIHEYDMAAVGVRALTESGHVGAKYELSGPQLVTQIEVVRILAEVLDRPLRFEEITPAEKRVSMVEWGWPTVLVDGALDAWAMMTADPETITSTVEDVTGKPAKTFREWAEDNAAAFV